MTISLAVLAAATAFIAGANHPPHARGEAARTLAADSVCFDGVIGAGARARRLILVLHREGDRVESGTVWLYGRPTRSLDVAVSVSGASLAVVPVDTSVRLRLRADWSPDAAELRATVARSADTSVVALRRATTERESAAIADAWAVGDWGGIISVNSIPVRLGVRIERGPCGILTGMLDSPDQGQNGLPLTAVRATADSLTADLGYADASVTIIGRGSDGHAAVFVQRGERLPFTARRGERVTESRRPQDPVRPFPYVEREARYENRKSGIRLAGTLTLPPGKGPHPAALLISGSGPQDRDETVAGHRPFLVLSDHLTRRGYAVLRVDDRGAGASTGNVLAAGLHDLAGDVAAGLDYLRAQPEIDGARIGLVGHSEGGYVAPIVAARDTGVAFLVLLAAPAAPGRDLLLAQRAAMGRADGSPARDVELDSLLLSRVFGVLDARPADDQLEQKIGAALSSWVAGLPADRRRWAESTLAERTPARDSASLELWKSTWFRSVYHHDPRPMLAQVRVPVLAIYGELDLQVPPSQSVPALEAAFGRAGSGRLTLVRVPGVNHMLQRAKTGLMSEYVEIDETIAPRVLEAVGAWLARTIPVS